MISDIAPLVTQPMIDHLRKRNEKPVIDDARGEFDIAIKGIRHVEKPVDNC